MQRGTVFGERFLIEEKAGEGGMGAVYRATDQTTGAHVALKLAQSSDSAGVQRFLREAAVLSELRHPAIVRYVAHGATPAGELFLAMEWLEGEDLEQRLSRAPLTPADSVTIIKRVAQALTLVHVQGVIHRDVKPSNIFLPGTDVASAKLLDFGIARRAKASKAVTQTGGVVGTAHYMAPEQVQGRPDVDARADVFALGAVLYECLVGRAAFPGDDALAVLAKVLLEEPTPLRELRPELPAELEGLLARMLSKRPAERPADAARVIAELAPIASRLEGLAAPTPVSGKVADSGASAGKASSVTDREQRLVCVLLVGSAERTNPLAETVTSDLLDQVHARMDEIVKAHGGTLARLGSASAVAVISGAGIATDQAARAARCALALLPLVAEGSIALAMGWANLDAVPTGGVIDRAADVLRRAGAGQQAAGLLSTRPAVRVDDVAAALLDVQFQIVRDTAGFELRGARALDAAPRIVLDRVTPCVGRDRELGVLLGMLDEVVQDSVARCILVTAAAGAGKSRLCYELRSKIDAREQPIRVWTAHGDAMRAGSPFDLLGQLVRSAASIRDLDPRDVALDKLRGRIRLALGGESNWSEVADFVGELAGVPTAEPGPRLAAARNEVRLMGEHMLASFTTWLARESSAHAVVLVLDDLHWGDALTVRFLDHALRELKDKPLLVVGFARPSVHDAFPEMWKQRDVQELRLAALSGRAIEKLVRQVLGDEVDASTISRITEQSEGNALYVEEIMRAVAAGEHQARTTPPSVLAMVQSRLEALDATSRRVLRAASIFGEAFWAGGVRAVFDDDEGRSAAVLDQLVEKEFLLRRPFSRFAGEIEYAFPHALVRDAAYAMLTEADRSGGHDLAGRWLERAGETDPLVLAEHAERGGRVADAARHYAEAASQAVRKIDFDLALRLCDRATTEGLAPAAARKIAATRGAAFTCLSRWGDARAAYDLALRHTPEEALEERRTVLMQRLISDIFRQDTEGLREIHVAMTAVAERIKTPEVLADALCVSALYDHARGRTDLSVASLRRALTAGGEHALTVMGVGSIVFYHAGLYAEAEDIGARAGRYGAKLGDHMSRAIALGNRGAALGAMGRYREAHEAIEEGREAARRGGMALMEARALALSCGYHYDIFDFDGAEEIAARARHLGKAMPFGPPNVSAGLDLALIALGRGQASAAEEAVSPLRDHIAHATSFHGWLHRIRLLSIDARIAAARGEWVRALELAERAQALAKENFRIKYEAVADEIASVALEGLGRQPEAKERLHRASSCAERMGDLAMVLRLALLDRDGTARAKQSARRIASELPTAARERFLSTPRVRDLGLD